MMSRPEESEGQRQLLSQAAGAEGGGAQEVLVQVPVGPKPGWTGLGAVVGGAALSPWQ